MRSHWFYSEDQGFNVANRLFCEGLWRLPGRFDSSVDLAASGGHQPEKASKQFWLPISVLPAGFTLNTLLYTVVWLFPFLGFRAARRTLRARRGLCTRCAYDLKGLPAGSPCPECGHVSAPSPAA